MRQREKDLLMAYFYNYEIRLEDNVNSYDIRACRRRLDSLDHLEEIIAKERLNMFKSVREDIIRLLMIGDMQNDE